jgi:hypothetical protein
MGCEARVHEKTNKHGTWAYHLVNGWYLFTSPEHYCTHNCHIKHTKSKRLSNTVQFQHKCITNPSITYANKVMQALAECVKAIQGIAGKARNSQATQDLQRIVDTTQAWVKANPHRFEDTITPDYFLQHTTSSKGVGTIKHSHTHTDDNIQIKRSMQPQAPTPRVTTDIPKVKPISALHVTTSTESSSKPTTLCAEWSSKRECQHKRQASRLRNAITPTSPTTCIRT